MTHEWYEDSPYQDRLLKQDFPWIVTHSSFFHSRLFNHC